MNVAEILQTIKLGDKLAINDWKARYTVCGISERYILAHYGQHYTIIDRKPFPYDFNGVRAGDIRCAPDWWIFGFMDDIWSGYHFTDEKWVHDYMASLERGDTELSQKRHAPIYFLSVVGHTDKYWAKNNPSLNRNTAE